MSERGTPAMRLYHRYLGYFLSGIMAVYAVSGVILIFRDTDFLKKETTHQRELKPGLGTEALGRELRIRNLKIDKEEGDVMIFRNGSYNKATGAATYKTNELPRMVERMTHLHKANTKDPLFFLNIFFGCSLLFFVLSAFWMFLPGTTVFRKGLYFAAAGVGLVLLMLLV